MGPLVQAILFGAGATLVLTAILRRGLLRLGLVDPPRADRWHNRPVPRPGGPGMVAAIVLGILVFVPRPWSPSLWGVLAGAGFVFAVGLLDDFIDLPNPLKLTLLILGAAVPLLFGVSFASFPFPFGMVAALLWILAITNAVNWLDNMDGLAAGTSAIAAAALAVLSLQTGDRAVAVSAALVGAASLAFLRFNFSPAQIFMGDSGSGFLGFMLASLTLLGPARHAPNVLVALVVPVLILSIPIFDSAVVTLARVFSGRRLFQGGRDHPSHRLVVLGLSERQAVVYLYGLSLVSTGAALLTSRMGAWIGVVLTGMLIAAFFVLGIVVTQARVYQRALDQAVGQRVVLAQLTYKRRLLALLLDLLLVVVAFLGAHLLRFEWRIPTEFFPLIGQALPLIVIAKISALYLAGAYREDWRYVGLLDLLRLVRATALGSLAVVAVLFLWTRLHGYSRAVFVIDWILTFGLLAGARISGRLLLEYIATQRVGGRRALIVGAGQGGITLLQELRNNPALAYHPVGFVDDDPAKHGAVIRGLPVLGSTRDIAALVLQHKVEEVLLAVPSMVPQDVERIRLVCAESGVACRAMRAFLEPTE